MPASFQEILNSQLFKFIVGEKADGTPTEFLIHQEAIAQISKPLDSLMKGGLIESQEGYLKWDDVSKETFEQFAQFAYTGDYSVSKVEKRMPAKKQEVEKEFVVATKSLVVKEWAPSYADEPTAEPEPTTESEPANYGFGLSYGLSSKKKKKRAEPEQCQFQSLSFPLLAPRNNHANTCDPVEHFEPDQSYSNVFLSHALLYVLGDFRLIDSLKALALYKLHKTLCVFKLDAQNIGDVIDLVRYAYSDEGGGGRSDVEGIGPLRSLVCQYLVTNSLILSCDDGFMELLGEGGQFVKDFFKFEIQGKY